MLRQLALAALGLAIFGTALLVVKSRHEARQLFVELQRLEHERDTLNERWEKLLLEQGTWDNHHRIERVARERLGMNVPERAILVTVKER